MSFFNSIGLKRYIASAVSVILEVLRLIPGTETLVTILEKINGLLGFTAVAHAAKSKSLSLAKLAAASAGLSFLIALAPFVSELQPLLPYFSKIAALLGAAALGSRASK